MATENITHSLRIGSAENYTLIDKFGRVQHFGNKATHWEDIQTSLIGKRLATVPGTVAYNYANASISFAPSGDINDDDDTIIWSIQYPHKAKTDGKLHVHIHWEQIDATLREWTLRYRIQKNGDTKEASWTTVVVDTSDSAFTYPGSGTINQITELAEIDMTGAGLSAVVQLKLTRSDAVVGNIEGTFVDAHYEADALGSQFEYVK